MENKIEESDNRIRAKYVLSIPEIFTEQSHKLFGFEHQLDILQEECSELIKAISKMKRGEDMKNIIEETAHVLMSIQMVSKIYGITQDDINIEIEKKAKKYSFNI